MNAISLRSSLGTCDTFSELHLNFAFIVIAILSKFLQRYEIDLRFQYL
jgi:hypothetical protein